ncbi:uncharacterized protein LOC124498208 [Dermatophagoides farinae]|uniref:uncharacterized protein LOC124498208 n=1 Tax=Dermatophagoides farinae TaxID=6954 RepID=UPI003F60AD93
MKDPLLRDCRYLNPSSSSSSLMNYNNGMTRSTISTSESGQELWPIGVKLGIVRLGYSAGKLKYTLVDEQDIVLAREYTFEARLEVLNHGNSNNFNNVSGGGAVVFAYAYQTNHHSTSIINDDNSQMILLQDLIWRRHYGPIPDNKRVVHRNHISMDNRLDNLCLLDLGSNDDNVTTHVWYTMANQVHHHNHHNHHHHHSHSHQNQQQVVIHHNSNNQRSTTRGHHYHHHHHHHDINNNQVDGQQQQQVMPVVENQPASSSSQQQQQHFQPPKSSSNDLHLTLYWAAIQQLPPEHLQQQQSTSNNNFDSQAEVNSASRCFDFRGNSLNDQESSSESSISYFECHYGPCVRIERCPREFSICGRCQETRYCGTTCQQLDWPYHKRYCRYKARRQLLAPYSYRSSSSSSSTSNSSSTMTTNTTITSPLSSSYSPRQRLLR